MANKDFYDRIADALEIISGNDSHVDDVDNNMDYYKRIAQALENIAENNESDSGGGSSGVMTIHLTDSGSTQTIDKTYSEVINHIENGGYAILSARNMEDQVYFYHLDSYANGGLAFIHIFAGNQGTVTRTGYLVRDSGVVPINN